MEDQLLTKYKWQIILVLVGLILVTTGVFLTQSFSLKDDDLEIVSEGKETNEEDTKIVVDISGAVQNPGVYKLPTGSRVEDALNSAGGLTSDANLDWVDKTLNRASSISDGQKIYIPSQKEVLSAKSQTAPNETYNDSSDQININSASQKDLESLSGIGPVYAQNIIEGRPYSSVDDLLSKKIISQTLFEKIKEKLTIY